MPVLTSAQPSSPSCSPIELVRPNQILLFDVASETQHAVTANILLVSELIPKLRFHYITEVFRKQVRVMKVRTNILCVLVTLFTYMYLHVQCTSCRYKVRVLKKYEHLTRTSQKSCTYKLVSALSATCSFVRITS